MSSIKWLSIPEGTQVRMTCDYGGFTKWQIVTRSYTKRDDSDTVYFVDYNTDDYGNHLSDYQWELIEEPKEEKPATRWLALPNGTKVRMICQCGDFLKWHIVTRVRDERYDNDSSVRFGRDDYYEYLTDDQWELIEESPTQWEYIQVRDESDKAWFDEQFVAFYEWRAITTPGWDEFVAWKEWRFPEEPEEVTLKNGKTYIVDFNDDNEMVLKLKK